MSAARVGHLELLLTHAWLLENLFLYRPIIFCLPIYPSSTQLACAHPLRLLWSNNTALCWCWEGEGGPEPILIPKWRREIMLMAWTWKLSVLQTCLSVALICIQLLPPKNSSDVHCICLELQCSHASALPSSSVRNSSPPSVFQDDFCSIKARFRFDTSDDSGHFLPRSLPVWFCKFCGASSLGQHGTKVEL